MSERDERSTRIIDETQYPLGEEVAVPNFAYDYNASIVSQLKDNFQERKLASMSPESHRSATPEIPEEDNPMRPLEQDEDDATQDVVDTPPTRAVGVKVPSTVRIDSPDASEPISSAAENALSIFNTARDATQEHQDRIVALTPAAIISHDAIAVGAGEDDDLLDLTMISTPKNIEAGVSMKEVELQHNSTIVQDVDVSGDTEEDANDAVEPKKMSIGTSSKKAKTSKATARASSESKARKAVSDVVVDDHEDEVREDRSHAEDQGEAETEKVLAELSSVKHSKSISRTTAKAKANAKATSKVSKSKSPKFVMDDDVEEDQELQAALIDDLETDALMAEAFTSKVKPDKAVSKTSSRTKAIAKSTSVGDEADQEDVAETANELETNVDDAASKKRKRPASTTTKSTSKSTSKAKAKATTSSSSKATPATKTGRKSSSSAMTPTTFGSASASKSGSLKVCFSSSTTPFRPNILKNFLGLGHKEVKTVTKNLDVLVVGNSDMVKTAKVLMAIALGKMITTDTWVTDSATSNQALNPADFPPSNNWGMSYSEDIAGHSRVNLFKGRILLVTPALKKEYGSAFEDIEALAKAVGVEELVSKPARNTEIVEGKHIVIGKETDDADTIRFLDAEATVFTKDFLTFSVLRNELDLTSEEFQVGKVRPKRRKTLP